MDFYDAYVMEVVILKVLILMSFMLESYKEFCVEIGWIKFGNEKVSKGNYFRKPRFNDWLMAIRGFEEFYFDA